jgi:hypothetical protein
MNGPHPKPGTPEYDVLLDEIEMGWRENESERVIAAMADYRSPEKTYSELFLESARNWIRTTTAPDTAGLHRHLVIINEEQGDVFKQDKLKLIKDAVWRQYLRDLAKSANGNGQAGVSDADRNRSRETTCPRPISSSEFVDMFVAPDFVIDDLLQRGFIYSCTGRTGDGKTAWGMYATVVYGAGLIGETRRVLYLAGENPDDVRARFIMTCEQFEVRPSQVSAHFIPGTFNLDADIDGLIKEIELIGGCDIIFVDTSAAYFCGDDENSNTQLGNWTRKLRDLCSAAGKPSVVVFFHPIKAARQKGDLVPRGGGACLAEVDGNLCIFSDDKITFELHWTGKLRGPGFEPIFFQMRRCTSERVKDVKGRLIPSVVAAPLTDEEMKKANDATCRDQNFLMARMLHRPNDSMASWAEQLRWISDKGEPQKTRVFRMLQTLVQHKLVFQGRDGYHLTESGEKEAKKILP